ncbi:MAG: class I SAM-dependent methyltransferase [Chloroflexota bacterium]|nr:class I SAM-dependent methyltransferase [Chloroflexota bacterium]
MTESGDRPFYAEFAWAFDALVDGPVERRCYFISARFTNRGVGEGGAVLDAGCGTGGYAVELARRGYAVTGLDAAPALVEQARSKAEGAGISVAFAVGDLLRLAPTRSFDGVLCRGVLNDFLGDDERSEAFRSFARSLRADGVLVLDVREWEATARHKREEPVSERVVETEHGLLTFRSATALDPGSQRLRITERHQLTGNDGRDRSADYHFTMRCWTAEELHRHLSAAGFRNMEYLGDYDEAVPPGASDRLVAVASLAR